MRFAKPLLLTAAMAALATPAAAQQQVCVYLQPNYQGQPTCVPIGQRFPNVGPALNDRIRSVQIPRGAVVTVCEHVNFEGACLELDQSVPNTATLGPAGQISSVMSQPAAPGGGARGQFGGQQPLPPQGPPPRGPQYGGRETGPPPGTDRDDRRREMFELRRTCEDGDRRACVQFGIIIGENRERRAQWRRENPELFWWER
jgi:hypothetical protein